MAVFNIEELNPGAWFDFDGDDVPESERGRVKVRAYDQEIITEIAEKYLERKVEYKRKSKRGELQRIEYLDVSKDNQRKQKEDLWDFIVMDWVNFYDALGSEIPCTRENKVLFMSKNPAFYQFVDKCLERLTPDVNEEVEEAEKN